MYVGNFSTWPGGGLIRWGLNDFHEAGWMPFTNNLVRLATSALLARSDLDAKVVGRTMICGSVPWPSGSATPEHAAEGGYR